MSDHTILQRLTRRRFLQGGAALGLSTSALLPQALQRIAAQRDKKISLLEDGGFTGSAWGWQLTGGASVQRTGGPRSLGTVYVHTDSGDYARFLVLGPVAGKTYTLTGWVRTDAVAAQESGAGAYFAASQFEFQGRPTEFTVDGKQATEIRYGNFTGTGRWQRFSQSVKCLPTTAWFEVVVGIYRASGDAWFSGLTFVEGGQLAELEETIGPRDAAEWAHRDMLRRSGRVRPRAAILQDAALPVRGAASDPRRLAMLLASTHDIAFLSAAQIADAAQLSRVHFDLLVLPYGETFPLPAKDTVLDFLSDGGDLFTTGGYAFQSPVIERDGAWHFYADKLTPPTPADNLLPAISMWKPSNPRLATITSSGRDAAIARVEIPTHLRQQSADWSVDVPATGEGTQYFFSARVRIADVTAAPDGLASVGVEQLDAQGNPAYAARLTFAELRGTAGWQRVERTFYLVPDCKTLRIRIALHDAAGTIEATDIRLEHRPPQVRINTSLGWPEDSLTVSRRQIGIFDPSYPLKRVTVLRTPSAGASVIETPMTAQGYAASGVIGMGDACWVPVLEAYDASGRKRGAAGALMHHHNGAYTRSTWAFFGVDNHDLFAPGCAAGEQAFAMAARALAGKCFLHSLETDFATYREGEPVRLRVLLSNYGLRSMSLRVRLHVLDGASTVFTLTRSLLPRPGQTQVLEGTWHPGTFAAAHYRVRAELIEDAHVIDIIESGFNAWKPETLHAGMPVAFHDNYFQVDGRTVFLQGTDDYLHTFIDQNENPRTWLTDAQGCRDASIDVYENLMGLRGPQHRPTETWWRWVDAMLLNTQSVGGIFFPGMLVFSNTAVSDADLTDQKAYVRAFAERYREAAGIMYYLNGDLELHDPNLPNLQQLYNDFLRSKYGNDETLRAAWTVSPPEAVLGKLTIRRGSDHWNDIRTLDDFQFRTFLVRRWLNALHDSIREVDTVHPVTAEFYQSPVSGIDLLTALGKLELANFGYFNEKDEDFYRFPQTCRFLDQSMRGKGINVGEFGVKTHPAWNDTGYYIEARTEAVEQSYFLSLSHYAFALGASKIQNWCWKYPADLTFEWGLNYPNDLVSRDVRAFYRNSGLFFRALRPCYEAASAVVLLASDSRMGGQGQRIVEGQLNAIRLLLDRNLRFGTLTDEFLSELPAGVKTIFYPLAYCPSDAIVAQLTAFVERGGSLYLSGDISYDSLRNRTRTARLRELCGVEFVSERYANIDYGQASIATRPHDDVWPAYDAAPSIVIRSGGAKVLLSDADDHPVVTLFERGKGRVLFSADPIELHGDPRYQPYAHSFYRALLNTLGLAGETMTPANDNVHCFRVPSQDKRQISVLVNHASVAQTVTVPTATGNAQLTLNAHLPGVITSVPGQGIQAVESSNDVFENGRPLLSTNLHLMAIAFGQQPLAHASRVLLLPMGTGAVTLHTVNNFSHPVLLMGEIVDGRWKQYAVLPLALSMVSGSLTIVVDDELSLSMLLLCDDSDRAATIAEMELWAKSPWKLEGNQ